MSAGRVVRAGMVLSSGTARGACQFRAQAPIFTNKDDDVTTDASSAAALNARYGLNPPHSEVVQASGLMKPGDALDMGCSTGRNALYLGQSGFDVTAVDRNPDAIAMLQFFRPPLL